MDRTDRTKIEREIKTLYSEHMTSSTNSNLLDFGFTTTADHQPKSNLLQSFLSSVGKRQSRIIKENKNVSISDELSIYRSLARRECNEIIHMAKTTIHFFSGNNTINNLNFYPI